MGVKHSVFQFRQILELVEDTFGDWREGKGCGKQKTRWSRVPVCAKPVKHHYQYTELFMTEGEIVVTVFTQQQLCWLFSDLLTQFRSFELSCLTGLALSACVHASPLTSIASAGGTGFTELPSSLSWNSFYSSFLSVRPIVYVNMDICTSVSVCLANDC